MNLPLGANIVGAVGAAGLLGAVVLVAQPPNAFQASRDHAAIQYSTRPGDNVISRLSREIEAGKVHLEFNQTSGYLSSLLAALAMPSESQLLVFSETSSQAPIISPHNPRALFFNDVASVGWVRGGTVLELAAQDPRQGVIFYTLEQKPAPKPRITRDDQCLLCHLTWDTLGVPGIL